MCVRVCQRLNSASKDEDVTFCQGGGGGRDAMRRDGASVFLVVVDGEERATARE